MDKTLIYIVYNGRWNGAENKSSYVDYQVKIIMVEEGVTTITYTSLIDKVCKELRLDPTLNSIKMTFDPKIGSNNKGMTIENDDNVAVFLYLIKNDPEFNKCPLVVEFEKKSQILTDNSDQTTTATTTTTTTNVSFSTVNEKEKDISVVVNEKSEVNNENKSNIFRSSSSSSSSSSISLFGGASRSEPTKFCFGTSGTSQSCFGATSTTTIKRRYIKPRRIKPGHIKPNTNYN